MENFDILDSGSARIYVDGNNEVNFIPYGMDIFKKLVTLYNEFKIRLTKERDTIVRRPHFLDDFDAETETGKLVANVSKDTSTTRKDRGGCGFA